MIQKILLILPIIFSSLTFGQYKDITRTQCCYKIKTANRSDSGDSLNFEKEKTTKYLSIGFEVGSHSSNLNQNSSSFNRDVLIEAFMKFNFSPEVKTIIAFTYWKSNIKEINTPIEKIPSETINSKGLKVGLDFTLFKIYNVLLTLGPSISFENITKAQSIVYTFGANVKLNIPLWIDGISLLLSVNYLNGSEAFDFGGGGINYSFFSYLLGIEITL